ncbi:hypothetical protein GUJ93_ZPchr0005g14379 [Zizania palustris]|uniref:Guanosine nucleotide diphosphate dissociation inhibitor n=1 Tax=Zizania palustris TaxID=103762 RepID=A0A8J5T9G3_ZIZPA|nr:hypothetical protein GUJ93_ZPchr0005g14379 [Zizania palustris]
MSLMGSRGRIPRTLQSAAVYYIFILPVKYPDIGYTTSPNWKHGLSDDTVDFIGHALALHRDDHYLNEPALDTVKRMKLYAESLARFQGGSPYLSIIWVGYVFCCSYTHNVAPKGKFIAFVSAEAETDNPQSELRPGIDLLGPVDELFFDMYDRYEPVNEPSLDNCFVSMSYDATTHFETTVTDVLNMYTLITGKTVDLSVDLSAASAAEEY